MSVRHSPSRLVFAALTLAAGLAAPARGQQPVPPNPQAPNLAVAVPLGMQRGTSLDLTLTGTNLAGPTQLWTSFPAKVTIPTDMNNGKDNARLRVRLEVPKDAPLGYHTLRLATTRGLSNFRLFCIDDLPQVVEAATNRNKATPQALAVPAVVVGRLDAEATSYFKITIKAGQRLSFDVLGRRLGSLIDPQLTLLDARTGRELPDGFSNDAPGCQTDPRLTYTFKEAGDVLIAIRDVTYRGGPDFWYRLRIGDFPCATTPIPMAAKRGSTVSVSFAGPHVEGVAPVSVTVPTDPAVNTVWVAPRGASGLFGWPVALAVSDHDEVVEQEPNNEPAKANRVPVPGGITARFQEKGDVDHFVVALKKGQRYVIEATSHELGSPAEVYMVLRDAKGAQVAVTNPTLAPRLDYTAPADGDYVLAVEHLLYAFGPAESYRVTVTPFEVDFGLAAGIDRFDVPQGSVAPVAITAVRRGYTGPIDVSVVGPAGLTGQATIPAGPQLPPNVPAGILFLHAKADLPLGAYPITIQGKATINGKAVVKLLSVRTVVQQQMGNLPYPPRQLVNQLGVAVTEKPPFTLTAALDQPEAVRGQSAFVTVTATRATGFTDAITLAPFGLPPTIPAVVKPIPANQTSVKIELKPAVNAPLGTFPVTLTGRAKFQNRDFAVHSPPANLVLVLPFELKAEPAPFKLTAGAKAKLKVTAVRKGGYAGPITLQVRNLPPNVTAPAAAIPAGQTQVEIELTAAPTAAPGDRAGVNVLGTAAAAGNQQGASPNFVVSVQKK